MIKRLISILFFATFARAEASLTFATNGDLVNVGSATSLDDLPGGANGMTVLAWVRLDTTTVVNSHVLTKDNLGATTAGWSTIVSAGGIAGDLALIVPRATTNTTSLSSTVIPINTWSFIAFRYLSSATPASNIYIGSQTTGPTEVSYAVNTSGSGAVTTDAAYSAMIGNVQIDTTQEFRGQIGWVGAWNRRLTVAEVQDQQWSPHPTDGNVLSCFPGFNGTGTCVDYSGNGNSGTVTGTAVSSLGPPIFFRGRPL